MKKYLLIPLISLLIACAPEPFTDAGISMENIPNDSPFLGDYEGSMSITFTSDGDERWAALNQTQVLNKGVGLRVDSNVTFRFWNSAINAPTRISAAMNRGGYYQIKMSLNDLRPFIGGQTTLLETAGCDMAEKKIQITGRVQNGNANGTISGRIWCGFYFIKIINIGISGTVTLQK